MNWGYPERFHQEQGAGGARITGIAGSPGVVEGTARVVRTVDEFDDVTDGDILVCQMTNPAWVVLFTKIAGLVTDTGGTTSHPAVLSREFGIPAVIGTSDATHRIRTGDRIRVDGSAGVVEILAGRARLADRLLMPASAPAGAIPRSVLADQVKERLLDGILSGRFPPDSRIVETQVARELGTSQAPVREALRGLEAMGVVEITPFRGARVRRATKRELLEAYAVRSALEGLGARLAVPAMRDADLDELAGHAAEMEAAAAGRRRRPPRRGRRAVPRPDRRAGRQRHAGEGLALARAVLADLPHADRARRRPRVVRGAPRADPGGPPGARRRGGRQRPRAPLRRGECEHGRTAGRPHRWRGLVNDTLRLSEEMAAGAARLRIDVFGGEPREHVLDDMSFMNYRLADVRVSDDVTVGGAGHRVAAGRREGDRL